MDHRYKPNEFSSFHQKIGYLVEECGEVMAAAGKTLRWGPESSNPELPEDKRERNIDWLSRELDDLSYATSLINHWIGRYTLGDGELNKLILRGRFIPVFEQMPPAHTKLLFLTANGDIYKGDMCYGMHRPWFCTHALDGETIILNNLGIKVVAWMPLLGDDSIHSLYQQIGQVQNA